MADVWDIIDVVNRSGDVEGVRVRHIEGKISGWRRFWLGCGSGGDKAERFAQAKECRFQCHLHVEVSRGLLFGSLDISQEGQESIDVCSLGVSSQVCDVVEVQDLIMISIDDDDDQITNPSCEPCERFFATVRLRQAFRCREDGRARHQAFRLHQRQAFLLSRANVCHIRRERFSDSAIGEDRQETSVGRRKLPLEDQCRLNLGAGGRREAERLAA